MFRRNMICMTNGIDTIRVSRYDTDRIQSLKKQGWIRGVARYLELQKGESKWQKNH